MKLTRKIILIFISVTIISSVLYYALGKTIIDTISSGELDRGPGRTNGVVGKIDGETNRIASRARDIGENFEIANNIEYKYGEEAKKEIIDIEKKIAKDPLKNMILVNNNFELEKVLKAESLDVNSRDTENILNQARDIMNKKENKDKGFFGGIVTTKDLAYIIGVKKITSKESENNKHIVIINPMDDKFIESIGESTGRTLAIVKDEGLGININDIEEKNLYGREFHIKVNEDSVDVYTKIEALSDGEDYYLKLEDDREVRNNATKNITALISSIIILTILGNLLVYKFIKKKIIDRVMNINSVVNKVTLGIDLQIELEQDVSGDEISILTRDLNNMFGRLKNYADNLEYIGSHDLLTSLINRNKLNEYISELKNNNEEFAMFFIDLDNFKIINDTLGHNVGDQLLCQVAKELADCTDNENVIISRIGGDEFVVIRKGENDIYEIEKLAKILLNKLNRMYGINNYSYEVKASMGISFYPQHSEDEVSLLQYSDVAMYISKGSGGNSFTIFDKTMLESLEIENKLKGAIKNEEFEVYYQPIYGVNDKTIIGAEALIRWVTEEGIIYPNKFIPLAKKTGDIIEIDMLVMRQAISLCREWIDKGRDDFYVSINASRRFLKQNNIVEIIQNELKEKNVPTSALRIEITEDEIIDDVEYTKQLLREIRKIGIKIYLDDFGTGYSSFNHIKTLPIDVVKIDRTLLIDIEGDINAKSIVETMINLCHSLNLKVVCEGVEDLVQFEILKKLKCDDIQGYYFSKPISKENFDNYLEKF